MRIMGGAVCFVLLCLSLSTGLNAQLQVGYYAKTCRKAESIVKQEVTKAVRSNIGLAAGLVRLHFHDCFVRGCDGSVLIDSTANNTAEKDSPINNPSLRGYDVIDSAKARLEATCKGVVSCADILAFAARDSAVLSGGVSYKVPAGRKDGTISLSSDTFGNLPGPGLNLTQLTQNFANKGLTQEEMVTLSGAHTIGRSHCTTITNRLYSFNTPTGVDPTLNATYAAELKTECPQGSTDSSLVVPLDPPTPNTLDTSYYANLLVNRGLFTSDQALVSDATTASQVTQNAQYGQQWKKKFAAAMVRMGEIGVLTGSDGEIRLNCRVVN